MRCIPIAALVLASAAPAVAGEYHSTVIADGIYQQCSLYVGRGSSQAYCFTGALPGSGAKVIAVPNTPLTAEEQSDVDRRAAKWRNFCRPTYRTDPLGVSRAVYAHPDCDIGRDE